MKTAYLYKLPIVSLFVHHLVWYDNSIRSQKTSLALTMVQGHTLEQTLNRALGSDQIVERDFELWLDGIDNRYQSHQDILDFIAFVGQEYTGGLKHLVIAAHEHWRKASGIAQDKAVCDCGGQGFGSHSHWCSTVIR